MYYLYKSSQIDLILKSELQRQRDFLYKKIFEVIKSMPVRDIM